MQHRPEAVEALLEVETFKGDIWENCAGQGHISETLKKYGYNVISTDLIDRGYCAGGSDFFQYDKTLAPNIVTNPPYKYGLEWVEHSLKLLPQGGKLALLLPIHFLESKKRKKMFLSTPPKYIYIFTNRIYCAKNGEFYTYNEKGRKIKKSSAMGYAWYVWVKGDYQYPQVIHL